MSAIEACRTEALGGHVAGCARCGHRHIAYNSCKNRHCPKCQGPAARDWMAARAEDLLPVEYFHVVFTLPAEIARIAYWNKKAVYDLLFKASAETVMTIAADPKRLGARVGMTSVLHTWGSALTHHPHVHMIVPGGGLSPDGDRWVACRPGFFLPVRVLSRLFRRLFLDGLLALHRAGHAGLLRRSGRAGRRGGLRRLARAVPQVRMGGLRQAALRRPRGGAGLPQPLHPPRRHLERPPDQRGRRDRGLPLEGLPHQDRRPAKGHAARDGRVHPPVPDPRPARRLSPHPALRPARQRRPQGQHREDPRPARAAPARAEHAAGARPRSSRSPCASRAPAAAARCASSRSSAAVSNRSRGRRHGSRRHDATPAALADPPPVPRQAPVAPVLAGPRPTS